MRNPRRRVGGRLDAGPSKAEFSFKLTERYAQRDAGPRRAVIRWPHNRGSFRLFPIKQVDVYREVLSQLDGLVGSLQPGERLGSERQLAEQLGVSRVSVREALRALESAGKVEIRRNAGTFVVDPDGTAPVAYLRSGFTVDMTFLQWLTEVRAAVEAKTVELAGRRPRADLAPVRELLARIGQEISAERHPQGSLDLRFEAMLAKVGGNPLLARLQRIVHQLWIAAWGEMGIAPGDRRSLHAEHLAILEALERGDSTLALRRMIAHVDRRVRNASVRDERRGD